MKKDIHPTYYPDAQVICACGNTWTTGSTKKEIRTEMCSKCHPFYTGEQRIVDTAGQVERFRRKLDKSGQVAEERSRRAARKGGPRGGIFELATEEETGAEAIARAMRGEEVADEEVRNAARAVGAADAEAEDNPAETAEGESE